MTTITTELSQELSAIAELKAGYQLGHADVAILQDVVRELGTARQRIAELEARTEQQPVSSAVIEAAAALIRRYIANPGTDSEFISCWTPSKSSIGTGGVWDEWKALQSALNTATPDPAPVTVKLPREIEPGAVPDIIDPTANPEEYACCVGADMWNKAIRACVRNLRTAGIKIAEGE